MPKIEEIIDSLYEAGRIVVCNCSMKSGVPIIQALNSAAGMLRKQVPVPAIKASDHDTWCGDIWTVCPGCKIAIDDGDRYCRHCGQAIKTEKEKAGD